MVFVKVFLYEFFFTSSVSFKFSKIFNFFFFLFQMMTLMSSTSVNFTKQALHKLHFGKHNYVSITLDHFFFFSSLGLCQTCLMNLHKSTCMRSVSTTYPLYIQCSFPFFFFSSFVLPSVCILCLLQIFFKDIMHYLFSFNAKHFSSES